AKRPGDLRLHRAAKRHLRQIAAGWRVTTRQSVRGLGEIALRVRNLEAMTAFYRDVIGLEVMRESKSSVFFRIADGVEGHTQVLALFDQSIEPYGAEGRAGIEPRAETSTLHHV